MNDPMINKLNAILFNNGEFEILESRLAD